MLNLTFRSVETVGRPLVLSHLVNTFDSSRDNGLCECGLFRLIEHTYIPTIQLGQASYLGTPYQETLSNFPFGSTRVTGVWLLFSLTAPDGKTQNFQREVVDRVGVDRREQGGTIQVSSGGNNDPLFQAPDSFAILLNPAAVANEALVEPAQDVKHWNAVLRQDFAQTQQADQLSNQQRMLLNRDISAHTRAAVIGINSALALGFAAASDQSSAEMSGVARVRAYADTPRITIVSSQAVSGTLRQSVDLLHDVLRVVASPDQSSTAARGFRMTRGVHETVLESMVLEQSTGKTPVSVATVMQAAEASGVRLVHIRQDNLAVLAQLSISDQAKARIVKTVQAGQIIVVPERMVKVAGAMHVGWWQIDPKTGELVGVGEDGTHQSLTELIKLLKVLVLGLGLVVIAWMTGILGMLFTLLVFIVEYLLIHNFQAAYNSTKSLMLHFADEIEKHCPIC